MQEKGVTQYSYSITIGREHTDSLLQERYNKKWTILQFYERYNGFCCYMQKPYIRNQATASTESCRRWEML